MVNRSRPQSQRATDPPLLGEDHLPGRRDELAHPLEVAIAAERRPRLALLGEDAVEHELGGDRGMVEAGQEQRGAPEHPRVADHQVLDRGALRVAQVQAPGHVGRRLDDHERLEGPVGGGARPVGGEDVGGQPALVDGVLELGGHVGPGEALGRLRLRHRVRSRSARARGPETERPARPADERGRGTTCWFGSGAGSAHRGRMVRGSLGAVSGARRTARERPSCPSSPRGSHRPALA